MDREYLDRLREDTRNDVESIEQLIGFEIAVKVDSSRANNSSDLPETLACEIDENGAQLLIPSRKNFPDPSVVHELLHIRRFLIDRVPKIVICDDYDDWSPEQETGLTKLDNQLEHLIIVPEELEKRPTRKDYWLSAITRALLKLENDNLPDNDSRQLLLTHWIFLHLVLKDEALIKCADRLIRQMDLADPAADYLEAARSSINSKEKLVRAAFHYLEIDVEGVCLQTLDTHHSTALESKLSDIEIDY